MQIRSVGIDLGKTTFHLVALSAAGKVVLQKKFTQKQLIIFTANLETSLIGMEGLVQALTSWDVFCENRAITQKLIPAQSVKLLVKSNKQRFPRCRGHRGRLSTDTTCASSRSRRTTNWTCKPYTACAIVSSRDERP